jgi:tetratricopeptide (TPR) repeat protein
MKKIANSLHLLLLIMLFTFSAIHAQTFYQPPYHPAYYGGNGYVAPAYYKPAYVAPYHSSYTPSYTPSYTAPSYKSSYSSYSSPSYKSDYSSSYSSGSHTPSYSSSSSTITYASDEDFDNMVSSYKEKKDYKTASYYADKITSDLSPSNNKKINDWKVLTYYNADQYDKIITMFDAGTITLSNPDNYAYVGYAYHVKQRYSQAANFYEKAKVATSSTLDKEFLLNAGRTNYKIENYLLAPVYFKKYLEKGGSDTSVYFFLGNCSVQYYYDTKGTSGNLDEALSYYNTLINNTESANSTNRTGIYQARARARFFKKDYAGTIDDCDRQIKYNPDEAIAYEIKAEALSHMKNNKGAMETIEKALKLFPDNADLYNIRAYFKSITNNAAGALPDINKAIELNGNDGNIYDTKGYILMKLNRFSEALIAFDKAIELDKEPSGGTYYFRGMTKIKLKDKTGACTDLNKAKELTIFMHSLITDADVQKAITANCK